MTYEKCWLVAMDLDDNGFYDDYYWFGANKKDAKTMMKNGKEEYPESKFKIFKFILESNNQCFYYSSCGNEGCKHEIKEWQRGWQGDAHGNPERVLMCDPCSRKYSGERRDFN